MKFQDLYGGSYMEAARLCAAFNGASASYKEEVQVARLLQVAAEFMMEILPDLEQGFALETVEYKAYIGRQVTRSVTIDSAQEIAATALAGDGLGVLAVRADEATRSNLAYIQQAYDLADTKEAARLALHLYCTLHSVDEKYGEVRLASPQGRKAAPFVRFGAYLTN